MEPDPEQQQFFSLRPHQGGRSTVEQPQGRLLRVCPARQHEVQKCPVQHHNRFEIVPKGTGIKPEFREGVFIANVGMSTNNAEFQYFSGRR